MYEKFVDKFQNTQAFPLIPFRNRPLRTKEAAAFFFERAEVMETSGIQGNSKIYSLSAEHSAEHDKLMLRQPESFIKESKHNFEMYFFRPNFAFSDKEILEAVKNYLKQYRHEEALGKQKLLGSLRSWKENQILALWDLTEWSTRSTGKKYTQPELADAMWPYATRPRQSVDYVDKIRKGSKPYMKEAITERTYLMLLDSPLSLESE